MTGRRGARRGARGASSRAASDPGLDLFLDPLFALANAPLEEARPEPAVVRELPAAAPGESMETAIPVSILNQTAKEVLQGAFPKLWVSGEVSDFKRHRNGHWYFCLGDGEAQIRCVVWSRDQRRIPASPDEGMQVTVLGQLTVYPARGDMQLVVTAMEAEGDGLTRKAIELVLRRLEADGLLAPERKRPLPRYPRRIGVVTSPDGAAIRDVIAVARRRWPAIEIVVIPAAVQGDGAPDELCAALDRLARWSGCDVAIVGRGGGGRDDLRAFNDERVARALASLPMPVVSAVGHEIDMTICDLVADLRAPTPSAAAEAVVPVHEDLVAQLVSLRHGLAEGARWQIEAARDRARDLAQRAASAAERAIERRRSRVEALGGRLHALSPLATLGRGFAVAIGPDGGARGRARQFAAGDAFELVLADGRVAARAESVRLAEDA
ncbi:MAG TPA: exodeoxyribonuclease VII large subunit [Gemmatimonadaceae bacterium]